jgi:hypothetical protein
MPYAYVGWPRSILSLAVAHSDGGGTCPEQHWGWLINGEEFYLRYRHGQASLHVGPEDCDWPNLPNYGWGACREALDVSDDPYEGDFRSGLVRDATFETLLARLRPGWLLNGRAPVVGRLIQTMEAL